MSPVTILGIETSCDETAIGIVVSGRRVLSNAVASSLQLHGPYGGVIPEIAARAHVEAVWTVLQESLSQARLDLTQIDAIAVTRGPGLAGALLVGLAFAKGMALSLDRPLIAVDHLAAHLYAAELAEPDLNPPYLGLVVSGGHTLLSVVHPEWRFELLGETKDDAVGESFDKVAKLLGLGYPGGPVIDRLSEEGTVGSVRFPRSQTKQACDFSFSGLKTAVHQYVRKALTDHGELTREQIADVAAGFQEAAVEPLVRKSIRACARYGHKTLVAGGGVACNRRLRAWLTQEGQAKQLRVVFPPPELCVDNGAMVAGLAYRLLQRGQLAPLSLNADPNLCLN